MIVVKRSGERERYDPSKTKASLLRAGVSAAEADRIVERLRPELYDGITTEEIYRKVNMMLDSERKAKFGLKKAIMNLGPDGYAFETFIAKLFEAMGYETKLRQVLQGQCIQHEVDVILLKDRASEIVECKFHNSQGIKCSVQTALYTYGRFLDLQSIDGHQAIWLVTNTRFSSDVVRYAECMGMKLLGWRYPDGRGLEELVEEHRLYPMTVMDIRRADMRALLEHDFVLAKDLLDRKEEIRRTLPWVDIRSASKSAEALLH
ncbi:MAG: restriction endonuclease [Methanomassiliicoccales archaeon]|nr:MAG: restriction endonuclease [Methanomassiliicoccales archaeon]